MANLRNIEVKNIQFSIENLEDVLNKYPPGLYKISWYTKHSVWDLHLRWNGQEFIDLRDKLIST